MFIHNIFYFRDLLLFNRLKNCFSINRRAGASDLWWMERNKPRLNYLSDMLFCTLCDRYSLSGLLFSPAARLALWVSRFGLPRRCCKAEQCLTPGLHHFSGKFFFGHCVPPPASLLPPSIHLFLPPSSLSLSLSQVSWGPSYPLCAPGLELAQHLWQENDAHNRIDRIKELIRGQRVLDTGSPVTVRTKNARDLFLIVDCGFHFCDGIIRSGEMLI